jgi:inward rectifier potassium channel
MSLRSDRRHKNVDNTGFGSNSSVEGGRLTNKDGSTNLRKTGLPFFERISVYHSLLRMSMYKFGLMIVTFYTIANLLFASIYLMVGVDQLSGGEATNTFFEKFMRAFFFSSQTLTTVGYGHVAPTGMLTNFVASTESFLGILAFAVVTGLIYGRFTRPRAYITFSHNMIIAPYKEGRGLMMRLATYKNNHLTDAEAIITAALHVEENGKMVTKFYPLTLEISKINSLALSWTIVHHMNEDSPMYGYSEKDLRDGKLELIVSIKAFDDHFSNTVQQRTSYTVNELIYGAKFIPMFERDESGGTTVLKLDKVNSYERVKVADQLTGSLAANA